MFKKNVAVTGFQIGNFIRIADGERQITGTPVCKRLLDGVGGLCVNSASYDTDAETWKIDLAAEDFDAALVGLNFLLAGCIPISHTISTNAKVMDDLNDLSQQGVRDAGKLAPSAGAPAAGSIDAHLDAIQAITDDIDVSDVTYTPTNNAGTLTITIGRTFSTIVSGLVIPADWETAFWTLKQNVSDEDLEGLVQIMVTNPGDENIDGLRCLNAVVWHEAVVDDMGTEIDETDPEPFDRELASLTVDQPGGRVTIYLQDDLTAQLAIAKRIGWDVKFIDANSDSTGTRGLANLVRTETQTV